MSNVKKSRKLLQYKIDSPYSVCYSHFRMRNIERLTQIVLAGAVVAILTTGFDKGIVRAVEATPRATTSDTVPTPTSLKEAEGTTTRVSVASDGTEGNQDSWWASISADGRYVAFGAMANNLVSGDTNGQNDVFVHDRQTKETTRVSVASNGTEGNGNSQISRIPPSISADGRFVTFISEASNLVSGDTNGQNDVFVHDRQTKETTRVSVASDGAEGNLNSWSPSISADGRYVAFESSAENLTDDDHNGWNDIFVHDQQTGKTTRVSTASDGTEGNSYSSDCSISADGRFVAFLSRASNLVNGDTNDRVDVFIHDRQTGQTTRVSEYSSYPSLSADGRYVAFESSEDVFVHDRQTGQTTKVSVASDGTEGDNASSSPSISADGRFVAFWSKASNLVSNGTNDRVDVFVHDRQTGQTTRVSTASDGTEGNECSWYPSMSGDGRYVAFESRATNLVTGDTNSWQDIFVHDRRLNTIYFPLIFR